MVSLKPTELRYLSIMNIIAGILSFMISIFASWFMYRLINPILNMTWSDDVISGTMTQNVLSFGMYVAIFFVMFYVTYYRMFTPFKENVDRKKQGPIYQ